jgi:hypothetical protein
VAPPTTSPSTTSPSPAPTAAKAPVSWSDQAADTVETIVLTVKDKTTVPLQTAARAVVYGLVAVVLAIILVVAGIVGFVRFADVYLVGWAGEANGGRRVYIVYLVLGIVFCAAGFVCWSRRTPKAGKA